MRYLWTIVVNITLDATLFRVTNFPARTLILTIAALRAKTNFIALTSAIAGNHRFRATDQSVSIIIGWATALCHVIYNATTSAFSASLATLTRIYTKIKDITKINQTCYMGIFTF